MISTSAVSNWFISSISCYGGWNFGPLCAVMQFVLEGDSSTSFLYDVKVHLLKPGTFIHLLKQIKIFPPLLTNLPHFLPFQL